ncbi:MAG: methylmalonyl Co-A mutase-associated GTPase MeaB [Chloroflexi bacterium]|nr:methylmalonyl Co-A mutase-associated GTPase MeaB [Chloroflexota bacterium]
MIRRRERTPEALAEGVVQGDRLAVARLITLAEQDSHAAEPGLARLYPRARAAHVIGVTGPPGAGKSTLVSRLARSYRQRGRRVGIVAVDPSSPFTGGAVLGDRIRMQDLYGDPEVFIRSMATRGALGGLARATRAAVVILAAFGCDPVLVETVGAGQDEVEVAQMAHTTVVVDVPGLGDDIQAIKAGLAEIADIFVINKADRDGAEQLLGAIRQALGLAKPRRGWQPPIVQSVATVGTGVDELVQAIERHWAYLNADGVREAREREIARRELLDQVRQRLFRRFIASTDPTEINQAVDRLACGVSDPFTLADELTPPAALCPSEEPFAGAQDRLRDEQSPQRAEEVDRF